MAQATLSCPFGAIHLEIAGERLHGHFACGSTHRRLVPGPLFTGDACLKAGHFRPAGKIWSALSSLPPGHWALVVQNLVEKCVEMTPPTWA